MEWRRQDQDQQRQWRPGSSVFVCFHHHHCWSHHHRSGPKRWRSKRVKVWLFFPYNPSSEKATTDTTPRTGYETVTGRRVELVLVVVGGARD